MDPVAAYELLTLIKRLTLERSLAVVLSSHRLEEIDALDEVVVLLDAGRVVFSGALRSLRRLALVTEVTLEMSDEAAAHTSAGRLRECPLVERVDRRGRPLEVVARTRVGGLLAALGPECARVVHVDEHSGSTRNLLQRVYAGVPG